MSDNATINVDFGIAALSFEGGDSDDFEDIAEEALDFFEADTFEGVVRELKSMDYDLEQEYPDTSIESGGPSGGTFQ